MDIKTEHKNRYHIVTEIKMVIYSFSRRVILSVTQ